MPSATFGSTPRLDTSFLASCCVWLTCFYEIVDFSKVLLCVHINSEIVCMNRLHPMLCFSCSLERIAGWKDVFAFRISGVCTTL